LEYSHGVMWFLQTTERWEKDSAWYAKKRPNELAAVLRNLERYKQMLEVAPNPLAVSGGFLHPESMGIVAVDQKGGGKNLQQTRLYVFAEVETRTLHLLTIGDKASQAKDILFCQRTVETLRDREAP
jgi:hypothetical protein